MGNERKNAKFGDCVNSPIADCTAGGLCIFSTLFSCTGAARHAAEMLRSGWWSLILPVSPLLVPSLHSWESQRCIFYGLTRHASEHPTRRKRTRNYIHPRHPTHLQKQQQNMTPMRIASPIAHKASYPAHSSSSYGWNHKTTGLENTGLSGGGSGGCTCSS